MNLPDSVSFVGFSFRDYIEGEKSILKPQLEKLGYTDITFFDEEKDSFGPLIRGVRMKDKDGKFVTAYYG